MKICHITTVHPAKDARIYYRMCRGLAARKIPVVLIAPGKVESEPYLTPSLWNNDLAQAGRLQRIALAFKAALAEDAAVYHFHDPELIPLGLLLKARRPRKAVVYDVHEDYPSMMRDKYWLPKWSRPAASVGARQANKLAARFLDGIVAADRGVANDFSGTAAHKTLVHYNFPVLDLFAQAPDEPTPTTDLVYLGGLGERTGIFVLFEALEILARSGLKPTVRLAGYTDGEAGLAAMIAAIHKHDLATQVEFHGRLAHQDVPAWLSAGRVGLVMLQRVPKFMKNIPTKMFEYWACGLPVVASDLPPIRQFLVDGQHGYLFDPKSSAQLAERLAVALTDPEHSRSLGREARRIVRTTWNNDIQIDNLIHFYEHIVERAARRTWSNLVRRDSSKAAPSVTELPANSSER